jgi:hypothetical protein
MRSSPVALCVNILAICRSWHDLFGDYLQTTPTAVLVRPEPPLNRTGHPHPLPDLQFWFQFRVARLPLRDRYDVYPGTRFVRSYSEEVSGEPQSRLKNPQLRRSGEPPRQYNEVDIHGFSLDRRGGAGA